MKQRLIQRICITLAAILWTLAFSMMAFALDGAADGLGRLGILIGLAACVPTGHLVVEYTASRTRIAMADQVEEIAERHRRLLMTAVLEVVGRADADRDVPRIGHP